MYYHFTWPRQRNFPLEIFPQCQVASFHIHEIHRRPFQLSHAKNLYDVALSIILTYHFENPEFILNVLIGHERLDDLSGKEVSRHVNNTFKQDSADWLSSSFSCRITTSIQRFSREIVHELTKSCRLRSVRCGASYHPRLSMKIPLNSFGHGHNLRGDRKSSIELISVLSKCDGGFIIVIKMTY